MNEEYLSKLKASAVPQKHGARLVGHCNKLDPREIVRLEIEKMTDEQLVFCLQPLIMLSVECRFARVPVGHNELEKSMK